MVRALIFLALPVLSLAVSNNPPYAASVAKFRSNEDNILLTGSPRNHGKSLYRRTSSEILSHTLAGPTDSRIPVWALSKGRKANSWSSVPQDKSRRTTQQHGVLVKRANNGQRSTDRGNLRTQPALSDPLRSPMQTALSQAEAAKYSPMRTHIKSYVREQGRQPQGQTRPIFTPLQDPPPRQVPSSSSRAEATSGGSPRSAGSTLRHRNQASSSRTPTAQRDDNPSGHSGTAATAGSQTPGSPNTKGQVPTDPMPKAQGNVVTKHVGLVMDWAANHPKLACAAGAVVLAGCSSITGAGLVSYGGSAIAKGIGVGLSMTGAGLGSAAGTTGAIVAVGEYKKNEKISEERMQKKFEEAMAKLPRPPSLGRISETIKQASESTLGNLKTLKLGIAKRPSSESLSSMGLAEPPIPEDRVATTMQSAPSELPSQRRPISDRFSIPRNLFRSRPAM